MAKSCRLAPWLRSLCGVCSRRYRHRAIATVLLALPIAIVITVLVVLLIDRSVFRYYRIKRSPPVILLIASTGVMFVLNGVIRFIIGPTDQRVHDGARFVMKVREFKQATGLNEGIAIKASQVISLTAAVVCVSALFWFLNKTRTGKSMRAYSDNEDLALLSGVNPDRVVADCVDSGGRVGGSGRHAVRARQGLQTLHLSAFAANLRFRHVGGIGNPVGVLGGFIIAFSEVTVTYAYKKFLGYLVPPVGAGRPRPAARYGLQVCSVFHDPGGGAPCAAHRHICG